MGKGEKSQAIRILLNINKKERFRKEGILERMSKELHVIMAAGWSLTNCPGEEHLSQCLLGQNEYKTKKDVVVLPVGCEEDQELQYPPHATVKNIFLCFFTEFSRQISLQSS